MTNTALAQPTFRGGGFLAKLVASQKVTPKTKMSDRKLHLSLGSVDSLSLSNFHEEYSDQNYPATKISTEPKTRKVTLNC